MVNKWTSEFESIVLQGLFEECNISFNKALCTKIAERVTAAGMECTPKAIENRLYAWKKKAISNGSGINSSNSTSIKKPATATTSKAGGSRAKGKGKKVDYEDEEDMGSAPNANIASSVPTSPAVAKKTKAKVIAKPKPKGKGKGKRAIKKEQKYEDESSSVDEATAHVSKKVKKEDEEVFGNDDDVSEDDMGDEDGEFEYD
ncbi:hypothetical protein CFE70_001789 [Pyrenophora teres f. teres 0-1]|uniref:Uncharacterized protein n=1 Tax=Pyrenophora teres f. teres (strain 0-1) TaxID=861557 RepID=E3RQA4_PYRTT|nr:hypothetical protein PTT_10881 [Pyrenophora teres f. teres 0-1]